MKATTDLTACVVDNGLYVELALRLARTYKRVLYQCCIEQPFPKVNEAVVGDGFSEVERVTDFWPLKQEIDLFVFPDVGMGGLQNELVTQGYPVWGSRGGCDLELKRYAFKQLLESIGLEVGPYHVCQGLTELRKFLWDKEDLWVKISKFRGTRETFHWANKQTSAYELDLLAVKLGPVQDMVQFIVEECIETTIEWGYDGYFCGGRFPTLSAHGVESKDKSYLGAMTEWDELPEQVRHINNAMAIELTGLAYCNFFSAEIRISEDGKAYFTDPTCRVPWPAGPPQLELYGNLSDIIWAGANGECIDPEPTADFAAEVMINHDGDEEQWRSLVVPEKVRRWTKLMSVCQVGDEQYAFPPFPHSCDAVGSLIGLGDTVEEAIEEVKEHAKAFKNQAVTINIDSLAPGLQVLKEAKKLGVELSPEQVPEPAIALE